MNENDFEKMRRLLKKEYECAVESTHPNEERTMISFREAWHNFWCCSFKGRASRAEYWFVMMIVWPLSFLIPLFAVFLVYSEVTVVAIILLLAYAIGGLIIFFPSIALQVRRLHDINRSGWWYLWICLINIAVVFLLAFITGVDCSFIGGLILLIANCTPGTKGENKFGPLTK